MLNCWISHTIKSFSEKCFNAGVQTHQTYCRHPTVGYCISLIHILLFCINELKLISMGPKQDFFAFKKIYIWKKIFFIIIKKYFQREVLAHLTLPLPLLAHSVHMPWSPRRRRWQILPQNSCHCSDSTAWCSPCKHTQQLHKCKSIHPSLDSQHWSTVGWSTEKRLVI